MRRADTADDRYRDRAVSVFFFGVRIRLGMNFKYLILWVRVKGQG